MVASFSLYAALDPLPECFMYVIISYNNHEVKFFSILWIQKQSQRG